MAMGLDIVEPVKYTDNDKERAAILVLDRAIENRIEMLQVNLISTNDLIATTNDLKVGFNQIKIELANARVEFIKCILFAMVLSFFIDVVLIKLIS